MQQQKVRFAVFSTVDQWWIQAGAEPDHAPIYLAPNFFIFWIENGFIFLYWVYAPSFGKPWIRTS